MLFDLWRRGFLEMVESPGGARQLVRARHGPMALDDCECDILSAFDTPQTLAGLPHQARLLASAQRRARALETTLRDELLLMPDTVRVQALVIAGLAAMGLVFLAGYKLAVAAAKGHHNIALLVASTILAVAATGLAGVLPRLTRRGADYLDRLRLAVNGWSDRLREEPDASTSPTAVVAVALLGCSALAGTPEGDTWQTIGAAFDVSTHSGGGCGAGAGCGGGGCGGGGCGGCGG
jgi:uncharacterized protein (TIGR04222 family)